MPHYDCDTLIGKMVLFKSEITIMGIECSIALQEKNVILEYMNILIGLQSFCIP